MLGLIHKQQSTYKQNLTNMYSKYIVNNFSPICKSNFIALDFWIFSSMYKYFNVQYLWRTNANFISLRLHLHYFHTWELTYTFQWERNLWLCKSKFIFKIKRMNSSDRWIYAYPIALGFAESEVSETFVTFNEPNLFVEPYDKLWIKMAATVLYLIGLGGSYIQYTFVVYEVKGFAASYRTAMNQLVSFCYFLVS